MCHGALVSEGRLTQCCTPGGAAFSDSKHAFSDSESVYGGPATQALLSLAAPQLQSAASLVEFGCGTAKLAERLLRDVLPPSCLYLGCSSPVCCPGLDSLAARLVGRTMAHDGACLASDCSMPRG